MIISFDNFVLRTPLKSDAKSLAKYADNKNIWINVRDLFPHPYKEQHAVDFINSVCSIRPETHFVIANDTEPVGVIGLDKWPDVYGKSMEIGYWLGEPFWNKGICTNAVKVIVEYGFNTFDINRIFAGVFAWNPSSARVLEKAGFELEGRCKKSVYKNGKFVDQIMYALVRE